MINGLLILAGIALFNIIFVLIPELLRRKREAQAQQCKRNHPDPVTLEIPADIAAAIKLRNYSKSKHFHDEQTPAVFPVAAGIVDKPFRRTK